MSLQRLPDWPERLAALIEDSRQRRFAWGEQDCAMLAADVFRAITGHDPVGDIRGQYRDALSAMRMAERMSGGGFEAAVRHVCDNLGLQRIAPALARRGDIGVAVDGAGRQVCVFCVGAEWYAPGETGLVALELRAVLFAWHVGEPIQCLRRAVELSDAAENTICALPAVIGVAGAVAGAAAAAGAAEVLGFTLATLTIGQALLLTTIASVVTIAISFVGQALFPADTPKTGDQSIRSDRNQSFAQPITAHRVVYGQIRVGGPFVYFLTRPAQENEYDNWVEKDSDYKDFLHLVIVLASHKCQEIGDIYLDDTKVGAIVDSYATGPSWQVKNRSRVRVHTRLGTDSQTAIDELVEVSGYPVTASIVFSVVKGYHIENDAWIEIDGQRILLNRSIGTTGTPITRGTGEGAAIIGYVDGSAIRVKVSDDLSDSVNNIADALQFIADNNLNSHIAKCSYKYKDDIGSDRYKVRIRVKYDGEDQIYVYASSTPKSYAQPPKTIQKRRWTANHRLRGRTYMHVRLEYDDDVFSNGIPNVSAVVKGRLVYDPRTGATAWSDNPALCIMDYLTMPWGLGCDRSSEIDTTSFIAAANACDEQIATLTGTEKRYTCNGVIDLGSKPIDIIESLLTSCAGHLVYTGGKWRLKVGIWYPVSPSAGASFSDADLRGPVTVRPSRSRRELVNTVRGAFVSPRHKWQSTDYPQVQIASYLAADGSELPLTLDLPFTTSDSMAQRIARIALLQNRRQATIDFPANLAGLKVAAGDAVYVTLSRFGYTNKTFQVAGWKLSSEMGVDLSLIEDDAGIYSHSTSNLKEMTDPGVID